MSWNFLETASRHDLGNSDLSRRRVKMSPEIDEDVGDGYHEGSKTPRYLGTNRSFWPNVSNDLKDY